MNLLKAVHRRIITYQRDKTVHIEDPALAGVYWLLFFIVGCLYTGVYQCLYLHAYAEYESVQSNFLVVPIGSDPSQSPSSPPYCDPNNTYYYWPSSLLSLEEKLLIRGYVNEGVAVCSNFGFTRHISINSNTLSVATFEFSGGPDSLMFGPQGRPRYWVKNPEYTDMTILASLTTTWLPEGVTPSRVTLIDRGEPVKSWDLADRVVALRVIDILQYAGIDLEAKNLDHVISPGTEQNSPTFRFTGVTISVLFECSNLRPFDLSAYNDPQCDVTIHRMPGLAWGLMGSKVVLLESNVTEHQVFGPAQWYGLAERSDQVGVVITFESVGRFGKFSAANLVRLLVEMSVLLGVARKILNLFAEHCCQGSERFRSYTTERRRLQLFARENGMDEDYKSTLSCPVSRETMAIPSKQGCDDNKRKQSVSEDSTHGRSQNFSRFTNLRGLNPSVLSDIQQKPRGNVIHPTPPIS